jgi:heat shock protein HslJ
LTAAGVIRRFRWFNLSEGDLMMHRPVLARRLFRPLIAGMLLALGALSAPATAGPEFPYGHEMRLDVDPLPGSKRVPGLSVQTNGAADIDLWCNSMQGQVVVNGNNISIQRGPIVMRECTPERMSRDDALLEALLQVTSWQRQGDDVVILQGAKPMRFRISTN